MQAALDKHNEYRQTHGASPLTWDDTLAQKALEWANGCKWEHSNFGSQYGYGENLYAGTGTFDGAHAVKGWYDEITDPGYNFNNPGFYQNPGTGHFTQVVWKGTTKVGCAVTTCNPLQPLGLNGFYFVCEYSPAGNVQGQFPTNVLRAHGQERRLFFSQRRIQGSTLV